MTEHNNLTPGVIISKRRIRKEGRKERGKGQGDGEKKKRTEKGKKHDLKGDRSIFIPLT